MSERGRLELLKSDFRRLMRRQISRAHACAHPLARSLASGITSACVGRSAYCVSHCKVPSRFHGLFRLSLPHCISAMRIRDLHGASERRRFFSPLDRAGSVRPLVASRRTSARGILATFDTSLVARGGGRRSALTIFCPKPRLRLSSSVTFVLPIFHSSFLPFVAPFLSSFLPSFRRVDSTTKSTSPARFPSPFLVFVAPASSAALVALNRINLPARFKKISMSRSVARTRPWLISRFYELYSVRD